ncbi:MAG: DUF4157 domain-containing protein [Nocardioidaceae bacterium]|nr:DUF4157 domain-containing protein [Nocardioidaceae bacterium]
MRQHQFDAAEAALRPKASRLDDQVTEQQGRAAAEGRPDVLGHAGLADLQRAAGNGAVSSLVGEEPSPVHDVISSGGRPLEPDVRADMEGRLGHDFGDVRVHDDGAADRSAQAVNAHAYTVGSNVVFQRDRYDPGSDAGRTMLAHELTHVVQQRSGPVDGTPTAGGIRVSDPSDRFEREAAANAERVMAAPAPAQPAPPAPTTATAVQRDVEDEPPVQRAEAEEEQEEETAQGSFVQRDEAPEEEEEAPGG